MSRSHGYGIISSAFNLNVTFRVLALVPRYRGTTWNFALSPSSPSSRITQPVCCGTKKSRFLNPGPYNSPLDRSRSFPIEHVDTIHVADHAARNEQRASSWETFRAVLTVRVSFRYVTFLPWNKDGRSPDDRGIEWRVRNREKKESIRRTFRNTCDASPLSCHEPQKYFDWIKSQEFHYSFARYLQRGRVIWRCRKSQVLPLHSPCRRNYRTTCHSSSATICEITNRFFQIFDFYLR